MKPNLQLISEPDFPDTHYIYLAKNLNNANITTQSYDLSGGRMINLDYSEGTLVGLELLGFNILK